MSHCPLLPHNSCCAIGNIRWSGCTNFSPCILLLLQILTFVFGNFFFWWLTFSRRNTIISLLMLCSTWRILAPGGSQAWGWDGAANSGVKWHWLQWMCWWVLSLVPLAAMRSRLSGGNYCWLAWGRAARADMKVACAVGLWQWAPLPKHLLG